MVAGAQGDGANGLMKTPLQPSPRLRVQARLVFVSSRSQLPQAKPQSLASQDKESERPQRLLRPPHLQALLLVGSGRLWQRLRLSAAALRQRYESLKYRQQYRLPRRALQIPKRFPLLPHTLRQRLSSLQESGKFGMARQLLWLLVTLTLLLTLSGLGKALQAAIGQISRMRILIGQHKLSLLLPGKKLRED
jgi:hypothetical protein